MSAVIQDALLVVRHGSDGAFSADSVISVDLDGTAVRGLALCVHIPAYQGSVPSLSIDIHASSTSVAASTDRMIGSWTSPVITATTKGTYIIPFATEYRSVAFAFRIGGGSTPSLSIVTAWLTEPVALKWTRTVEFR